MEKFGEIVLPVPTSFWFYTIFSPSKTDMTFKYFSNIIGITNFVKEPYGLYKHTDNFGNTDIYKLNFESLWKYWEADGELPWKSLT